MLQLSSSHLAKENRRHLAPAEAGLSLSASELCWGTDRGACLGFQLEKLCSSSSFPTVCLEGPSTTESPQLRQKEEIHREQGKYNKEHLQR